MTSCLQTLPPIWNDLFKQRSENSLDGDPALQAKYVLGPEWAEPQPAQQSERVKRVMLVSEVKEQELEAAKGAAQTQRTEGVELQKEDLQDDLNAKAVAITDKTVTNLKKE